jgi:3-hydroxyacyl-[acyl-carrier-protein] dehydratase
VVDTGLIATDWQIASVKFLSPLKPNETVMIEHEQLANGTLKFAVVKYDVLEGNRQIVMGNLVARHTASEA